MNKPKVIVIGIDGADWQFVMPMVKEGRLPVISEILKAGVHGDLESVLPPVTCPAWKCYSTGKNPGELGVYWWVNWDRKNGKLLFPSSVSFKARDIWEHIGSQGGRVGVINMPTTFPPKEINGVMVSGFGAPMNPDFDWSQSYTFPPEFQKELEDKYSYKINIEHLDHRNKQEMISGITDMIKSRFDVAADLLKKDKFDFFHFSIFYINFLRHHYGHDDAVKKAWELIDKRLGEFINDQVNTVIFSDHGMMDIETSFAINTWLRDKGYEKWHGFSGEFSARVDLKLRQHIPFLEGRLLDFLRRGFNKIGLSRIGGGIRLASEFVGTNELDHYVDWVSSDAVAISQGPIFINHDRVKNRYDEVRENIKIGLEALCDPRSGKKVIEKVYRREEIYSGPYFDSAPDLLALPTWGFELYGGLGASQFIYDRCRGWTTGNHPKGIFAAVGPEFKKGFRAEGVRIIDLAPTILHSMGLKVPEDMDGMVRQDLFADSSSAKTRPVIFTEAELIQDSSEYLTYSESVELKEKLIGLGYLG